MKRLFIIAIFSGLTLLSPLRISVSAQTEKYEKALRENKELQEKMNVLNTQIKSYHINIADANEDLNDMRRRIKVKEHNIDNLKERSSKEAVAKLDAQIAELENELQLAREDKESLRRQIETMQGEIGETDREIENMALYERMNLQDELNANLQYLQGSLSSIQQLRLHEMLREAPKYKGLEGIRGYSARIQYLVDLKQLRDDIEGIVEGLPTTEVLIKNGNWLYGILSVKVDAPEKGEFKLSDRQRAELEPLMDKLSRYRGAVNRLKKMVVAMNGSSDLQKARAEGNEEESIRIITRMLSPAENTAEYQDMQEFILRVPYTSSMYERWKTELLSTPAGNGKVEQEILNIEI